MLILYETTLALGDSSKVRYNEEIQVLGYPLPQEGVEYIAVAGKVQGFRSYKDVTLIQHDAPTEAGHSGGPVIDAQGEIIAVHTSWIGGKHSKYTIGVAINSVKRIIPYGVLPSGPSPVQLATGPTAHVGPIRVPQDYSTLQAAMQAAGEGAVIKVSAGTYQGDISITKSLSIVGEEGAILAGTLKIRGVQNVSFESFEIRGGVEIYGSSSVTLSRLTIQQSPAVGITMERSSASILNCTIEDCAGPGIDAAFGSQATLRENKILRNAGDGVSLSFGSQARIIGNTIVENTGYGISASSDVTVIGDHNLGWANARGAMRGAVSYDASPCIRIPEDLDEMQRIPEGSTGTLVFVSPGTHAVNLLIRSSLTLRGAMGQSAKSGVEGVVNRSSATICVSAEAAVTIENLVISGSTTGLEAWGKAHVTLTGCTISDNADSGLVAAESAQIALVDCTVSQNGGTGLYVTDNCQLSLERIIVSDNHDSGLLAAGTTQLTIVNSTVSGNEGLCGLRVTGSATASFHDSNIRDNEDIGLLSNELSQVSLNNCTVSGNSSAIFTAGEARMTIQNSLISENYDGLIVHDAAVVTIEGTSILNAGEYAVEVRDHAHVSIRDSQLLDNRNGVLLQDLAVAKITGVTFSSNEVMSIEILDSARAHISGNSIEGSSIGIYCESTGVISGTGNKMFDNYLDLWGNLPGSLRVPLTKESETEIEWPDTRYSSLQVAVDALIPGGKLILESGKYGSDITIAKEIRIEAAEAADVTLKGSESALSLVGTAKVELVGVKISGGAFGITIASSASATISHCSISCGDWSRGVQLMGKAQATFQDCIVSENMTGFSLYHSAHLELLDCTLSANSHGISIYDNAQAQIIGCTISGFEGDMRTVQFGIELNDLSEAVISSCVISSFGPAPSLSAGIILSDSCKVILRDMKIINNGGYGISIEQSPCDNVDQLFGGQVMGSGNVIPGPEEPDGNQRGALCPAYPGDPWPEGFLKQ